MTEIICNNKIRITSPPDMLKNLLVKKLRFTNPKWSEAMSSGRSVYNIPQYILNFTVLPNGDFLAPRGIIKWVLDTLNELKISHKVINEHAIFDFININSQNIKYRPYQFPAVTNLVNTAPEGVLVAPAGSGKTVMGLSVIPVVGQPTLWLVHTGPLAKQAKERAETLLPDIGEIGLIGKGKWKKGEVLTIGMIQTLVRNPSKLIKSKDDYGLVICDECLPTGHSILMLDGSVKDILEVKNGDVTTFGRVSNKFSRKTNTLIELIGGWGSIKGTPTHRLPFVPYSNLTKDKHKDSFRPLTEKEVSIDEMASIEEDDFLLIRELNCHTEKYKIGTDKARMIAFMECGSHIERNLQWGKHKLYAPSIMEHASLEDIKSYIQVVFDRRGDLNNNQIAITMATQEYLYGVQHLLRKFGIISRIVPIKDRITDKGKIYFNYVRLALSGLDVFLFWKKIGFSTKRKQDKLFEIIKRVKKFARRVTYKGVLYRCMRIVEKNELEETTTVHDFTTEGHFFIANGVLSSNCHHVSASTFTKVITHLNPYYLYGLTATPYRKDKMEELMFQTLGETKTVIPIEEVARDGGIIVPKVRYRAVRSKVETSNQLQPILKNLITNKIRNNMIVSDVLREAMKGHFCIVISDRRAHCETLRDLISIGWKKTGIATGKYSKKYVSEQIKRYETREITVLVATFSLLGEGFDVPFLDRAFITMPFRAEAKAEQLIGRIQRTYLGKKDAVVYDYVDVDIGILKNQFHNITKDSRYRAYKRLGVDIEPY